MDRKKLIIYAAVALAAVLIIAFIIGAIPRGPDVPKVGICVYDLEDTAMATYAGQLEAGLAAKGFAAGIADAKNDQTLQNEQIAAFIKEDYDALIICPVMLSAAGDMVQQLQDADIPAVLIRREPDMEILEQWDRLSYVGCDPTQPGALQAELILELPDKGDVNDDGVVSYVLLQGDVDRIDTGLRSETPITALTDAALTVSSLATLSGEGDRTTAAAAMTKTLSELGKDIEVVLCNNDAMALGALEAIIDGGRSVGEDIYLVGIDGTQEAMKKVLSGELTGTVMDDYAAQTLKTIEVLEKLLNEEYVGNRYYVNHIKITAANAAQYVYE